EPVLNDADVVRREVPQGIDVRPDPSQVQALAVDVADLTQLAGVDQPLHVAHGWVVDEGVPGHQDEPLPIGQACENVHFHAAGGQGLLHEDVLAGLERPGCEGEVSSGGGGNDHAGDVGILEGDVG